MPNEANDTTTTQGGADASAEQMEETTPSNIGHTADVLDESAKQTGANGSEGQAGANKHVHVGHKTDASGTKAKPTHHKLGKHSTPSSGTSVHIGAHHVHSSSEEENTSIKIEDLRAMINTGTQSMGKIFGMLDTMQALMVGAGEGGQGGSAVCWEGTAADRFREVFSTEMSALRADFEELGGFTRELEYYISAHEEAAAKADQLAGDIDEATWTDV